VLNFFITFVSMFKTKWGEGVECCTRGPLTWVAGLETRPLVTRLPQGGGSSRLVYKDGAVVAREGKEKDSARVQLALQHIE